MKAELQRTLQNIGLKPLDTRVYLALLETGESTAYRLANQLKVSRPLVYSSIDRLAKQRLLTQDVKSYGKKVYPADPDKVLQLARRRQREARRLELKVEELVPFLHSTMGQQVYKPEIEMHFDIDGIKEIYQRALEESKEMYSIVSSSSILKLMGEEWIEDHTNERVKRGINLKLIDEDSGPGTKLLPSDKKKLRETRYIAQGEVFNVQVLIYAPDTISIVSADKEKFGMVIKSEHIYKTMLGIFNMMWSNLPFSRPYIL